MNGDIAALTLSLHRSNSVPAHARSVLRRALSGGPLEPHIDDVVLATSELVTNVVNHTTGDCDIRARWSTSQPWVRVEIADTDGSVPDLPGPPSASAVGGRGLLIVEAIADKWGVQRTPNGKIIWFEVGRLTVAKVFELLASSSAAVGQMVVRRALPQYRRRTVGSWCFADHMGPTAVTDDHGIDVAPHPHCGLQTVTWLLAGEMLHRDSLGSEQLIRSGELNLMTAGAGVSHSEESTGRYTGDLHGIQLWVAQPEATRHGEAAFEHHDDLPRIDLTHATATVLVGDFGDVVAAPRRDTDHVGVDLLLRPGTAIAPLRVDYEHAIVMLEGTAEVDGQTIEPGSLGYLGFGRDELTLTTRTGARAMLLGGVPFPEPIQMSWNFVGRSAEELEAAHHSWNQDDGRFGRVNSALRRFEAPARSGGSPLGS